MVIVHVVAPAPVGGLEQVVAALAAGQRQSGHDARVVAVLDAAAGDTPFLASLRAASVPVTPIALPARAYRMERSRLAHALGGLQPDVAHTHGYRADIQGGAVARRLGCPSVTTVHGFTGGGWKNRLYERLQRRAFRGFSAVVAVSQPLAVHLASRGIASDRIHVIPNAAPELGPGLTRAAARRELRVPEGAFVVGWVGRLSLEKGPDILVEMLARLPPPIEAIVIGDGAAAGTLARLAEMRGVADRIHWRGLVPDAGRLFAAFDCFALTSRTEGTPIVLFEAMAAGVPIVATAVGGVPDVVSEGEALLVPAETPDALAMAVTLVATEPRAAEARAASARRRLESERRAGPWIARYDAVYGSVLAPSRSSRPA